MRDEIGKRLTFAEKGKYEKLLKEALQNPEKHKRLNTSRESVDPAEREDETMRRAATAADRGRLRTVARLLKDRIPFSHWDGRCFPGTRNHAKMRLFDRSTSFHTTLTQRDKCNQDRVESATATFQLC